MTEQNITRLTLNLPALNRLLGGDSEIEVRLRHQVVEEFAKKHLKAIANSDVIREMVERLERLKADEIRSVVGEAYGSFKSGQYVRETDLRTTVREMITKAVKDAIKTELHEQLTKLVEDRIGILKEQVDQIIKMKVLQNVDSRINAEVEARLKAVVQKVGSTLNA